MVLGDSWVIFSLEKLVARNDSIDWGVVLKVVASWVMVIGWSVWWCDWSVFLKKRRVGSR